MYKVGDKLISLATQQVVIVAAVLENTVVLRSSDKVVCVPIMFANLDYIKEV